MNHLCFKKQPVQQGNCWRLLQTILNLILEAEQHLPKRIRHDLTGHCFLLSHFPKLTEKGH